MGSVKAFLTIPYPQEHDLLAKGASCVTLSGIINVDKPPGWTSFDVVKFIRGRCGERRVGHAGALDPAATGVLPILIGQATRLTEYVVDSTKSYEATIELGVTTDTYDAEGDVVARQNTSAITRTQIDHALDAFRGEFLQRPPAYSAIKRQGVPLYKRARRGEEVTPDPRPVRVEELDITDYEMPILSLSLVCHAGFYVRSLAHDLGAILGIGGMLKTLRRTRVGGFRAEEAVSLDQLRPELEAGRWRHRLHAPDEVLLHWRAAILGEENATRLWHGQEAMLTSPAGTLSPGGEVKNGRDGLCRVYSLDGDFLGVTRLSGTQTLTPEKMFFAGQS
jgi:tRNA pseudouridine55 synthase